MTSRLSQEFNTGSNKKTFGSSSSTQTMFGAPSSASNPASGAAAPAASSYPNLSVTYNKADLKYAEQLYKAFCLMQEHNINPQMLVADLPQEAKNMFSQIENFRSKEIESKNALLNKMRSMGPSLGFVASDSVDITDTPLPIDDKLTILLRELKNLKLKLQKDDAIAKELNASLDAHSVQAKKVQHKLQTIKSRKEPTTTQASRLNQLGNVPFSHLLSTFSQGSSNTFSESSFAAANAESAYDLLDYFIQLYADLQNQSVALKAELLKIHNAINTASFNDPPSCDLREELVEKIFALSRHEMSIRKKLFAALNENKISYPLSIQKSEPKDILGLGNVLFQPHYVPKAKQDDVLFEIANVEFKPADLSKLTRK